MIDTTLLPPEIQDTLADHQPIQWIPLPAQPGQAEMMIPTQVRAMPRLIEPWELDQAVTTPATRVYRLSEEHLAALVHGNSLALVKASDEPTLDHTLDALSESQTRDHPHERSR